MKQNKAFTVVELMIVVLIIALLALIAVPSYKQMREKSRRTACLNNLRIIDNTKQIWAMAVNATNDTPCDMDALEPFFKTANLPVCPNGGTYTVGTLAERPTCSVPEHANIY